MNADPTVNTIIFEVKRLLKTEKFIEQSPTQAHDGIRAAWRAVQRKTSARPAQVSRIYSEWEPSPAESAFLSATFPGAGVYFSFSRPTEDEWAPALQSASQTMLGASGEAPTPQPRSEAALFPVLRDYAANDGFARTIVHRAVGTDLAVFLAHVGPTPRGTIGIDYVMQKNVGPSAESVNGLFEAAWRNLGTALQIDVREAEGGQVLSVTHPSGMASGALSLPDFYEQACSWVGREEVFAAFPDPDTLFLTAPGSPAVGRLRQAVEQSQYWGAVALTPACCLLSRSGLRRVAVRPAA